MLRPDSVFLGPSEQVQFPINNNNKMDSVDLREMREKLRCYKETGKTVTIAILKQLLKTEFDPRYHLKFT